MHLHESVPFLYTVTITGSMEVKWWRVNKLSLELDLKDLQKLLTRKTRLVCFTHCSNILGGIMDVKVNVVLMHVLAVLLAFVPVPVPIPVFAYVSRKSYLSFALW